MLTPFITTLSSSSSRPITILCRMGEIRREDKTSTILFFATTRGEKSQRMNFFLIVNTKPDCSIVLDNVSHVNILDMGTVTEKENVVIGGVSFPCIEICTDNWCLNKKDSPL